MNDLLDDDILKKSPKLRLILVLIGVGSSLMTVISVVAAYFVGAVASDRDLKDHQAQINTLRTQAAEQRALDVAERERLLLAEERLKTMDDRLRAAQQAIENLRGAHVLEAPRK